MNENVSFERVANHVDSLRAILKSQYHAALAMLRQAIEECPPETWDTKEYLNSVWQIAYHTLFFTHLYLQPDEASFQPWEDHQSDVQYPSGFSGPNDPESSIPLIPEPYTRDQILEYWHFCDRMVDGLIDTVDITSPESGFWWYKVSKLEHQIINIRHIQHGTAQLADRVRAAAGIGIEWVGVRKS
jgi:hypothetical protein